MRHVFDTDMVAHVWAQQSQDEGRNKQGNLYFRGPTLFSYRDPYPIGHFITRNGKVAVLIQENTYSSTTSGHIRRAREAVRGQTIFTVPEIRPTNATDHARNWGYYITEIGKSALKAKRAHLDYHINYHRGRALRLADEARAYSKFFGLRKFLPLDLDTLTEKLASEREKIEAAERKRQRERHKRRATERSEELFQWRTGNRRSAPYDLETIALRVHGDEIETSQGAQFPVEHGKRAFQFIADCRARGASWERNGHSIHLGHFTIDSIDSQGNVKAGCHYVMWPEIEAIARQLGMLTEEVAATA